MHVCCVLGNAALADSCPWQFQLKVLNPLAVLCHRVHVAKQGLQGVMWVDGGDNRTEPPLLPDFSTVEGVQAAARQPYAHLHASLLHALAGPHAEVAEQPGAQALSATGLGLEQARSIDPVFSVTMQRTLQALRMFTFS